MTSGSRYVTKETCEASVYQGGERKSDREKHQSLVGHYFFHPLLMLPLGQSLKAKKCKISNVAKYDLPDI